MIERIGFTQQFAAQGLEKDWFAMISPAIIYPSSPGRLASASVN
jgi:hypothetical protein